jgi:hypothetical protein
MGVVAALTYARCQIGRSIAFETDSQNAPRGRGRIRLKEKGGALSEQLCLASAWPCNNGPIFFGADHLQRIRLKSFDPYGLPILGTYSA